MSCLSMFYELNFNSIYNMYGLYQSPQEHRKQGGRGPSPNIL
jgi:hypothetical protein